MWISYDLIWYMYKYTHAICNNTMYVYIYTYIYIYGWWFQTFFIFHFIYGIYNPSHWRTPSFFKMGTLHHQPVICLIYTSFYFSILGIIIPTDWYIYIYMFDIYKTCVQYDIIPVICLIYNPSICYLPILWLVVWNIFYFSISIYWEYSSQLTNIFQRGWNHQPEYNICVTVQSEELCVFFF